MKLDAGDVRDLVAEVEDERSDYARAALAWEKMWKLDAFEDDPEDRRELDQVEQVATADPYNIVQLVSRFVSDDMRVEIPYLTATDDDEDRSTKIEEWLTAYHMRNSRQQGRNIIRDKTWMSAVRGRGASQTLWVEDVLPKRLVGKRLPILTRNLDPLNVGFKYGPLWTEYAYHKYRAKASYIKQHYPDFELPMPLGTDRWRKETQDYEVIDFWYSDDDGNIWNCVSVGATSGVKRNEHAFAKKPQQTDYPEIPIVEWTGDGAPLEDQLSRSLSILHPLHRIWPAKCRTVSHIATAMKYYTNPIIKTRNLPEEIQVGPGAVINLTNENQDIDAVTFDANIPIAQTFLDIIEQQIGQATFPPVMYGDSGNMQAGYGVNILAQQARGRINAIRNGLETAIERENELILSLVETFGGDEGVEIWGGSSYESRKRPITLTKKDIKGNYANEVNLIPEIPTDETQRITTWMQLVKERVISKSTFRDRILNVAMPRDEDLRVSVEDAFMDPALAPKKALRSMQEYYKNRDDWEQLISGTPLDDVYQQEMAWKEEQAAQKEANKLNKAMEQYNKTGVPPKGYHVMPDGTLMSNKDMEGASSPLPGPMTGPMPPGMMPPMPQTPLPMDLAQGMPPGGPPPDMQPPGLPGVPGQMTGQIMPQDVGLTPQDQAGMLAQMQGDEDAMIRAMEEEQLRQSSPPPMP